MGDGKTLYESESRRSVAEVVDFLQELTQWLGNRQLIFEDGGEQVVVAIPDEVELEIELEEKDGKNGVKRSLEIEIEWFVPQAEQGDAGTAAVAEEEDGSGMTAVAEEQVDPALAAVSEEEEALVRDFIEDLDDLEEEE